MAKKATFNNPDSQEREYTRLLLSYSKGLQRDANAVLLPRIDDVIVQFRMEAHLDAWTDTLDSLIAELGRLALEKAATIFRKLPGMFSAVSKFNEGQFKLVVKANTGLPLPPVMTGAPRSAILGVSVFRSEPYLEPLAAGWVKENTNLISSIPTRLHPELEGIVRRGVTNGLPVKEIKDQIKARYPVTDYRAKLIAQDQTLKLNADLTRYRLQSVGVKRYKWRTVQDSRVRDSHVARNGKEYGWDKPPAGGQHPGQEVRCRCRAEAIWDDEVEAAPIPRPSGSSARPFPGMAKLEPKQRLKMAASDLNRLAKNDTDLIPSSKVFGTNKFMDLDPETMRLFPNDKVQKYQLIPTKGLHFTQSEVQKQGVEKYIGAKVDPNKVPEVVKLKNGSYLILDGHHRATAQVLQRFTGMRANIVGEEL